MKSPARLPTPRPEPNPSNGQRGAGHHLALGLRAAYLTFHRRANAVFAPFKVTADQFVVLTALAECDGMTQKELTRRTNSDPNTISEMLGRLERRDLVARECHADDGRALRVSLTEAGRELQRRSMAGGAALRQQLANLIAAHELEKFIGHLNRIVDGMSATAVPPTCSGKSLS